MSKPESPSTIITMRAVILLKQAQGKEVMRGREVEFCVLHYRKTTSDTKGIFWVSRTIKGPQ